MSQYPLLCLAIAMAAGLFMSRLIRYVRLPNVTAYLIAGVLLGPVFGVLDVSATSSLSIISDVAPSFRSEVGRLCLRCGSDVIRIWDKKTCPVCGGKMEFTGKQEFWT